jgi:hypothetical protein
LRADAVEYGDIIARYRFCIIVGDVPLAAVTGLVVVVRSSTVMSSSFIAASVVSFDDDDDDLLARSPERNETN